MAITAGMVKELREMTGAGMMDCKKALTATEGDMDKAVEFLREKGLATAQKKAGRIAAEGLCKVLVSEEYIAHEKEILLAQIMNDPKESQKPQKVIDGMINGRINKELKEICLLDQVYVKAEDGKQTVQAYVDSVAKAAGAKITVKGFVRFETGEGIEKKEEDFAAEVAKQMAGK